MSSTYSPAPSECGSVGLAISSCDCGEGAEHELGDCLKITAVNYVLVDTIAPLTPMPSPTRRRPEEAILMDDLRRVREEMQALREELQKTRGERDKWRNRNHSIPLECYEVIKQHGLASDLSITTLQHLDTHAAVQRLEAHEQYMGYLFAKKSCDFAATIQTIILEIQFVKTNMPGDTLRWRLYSALKLMLHISKGLQSGPKPKNEIAAVNDSRLVYDDYLKSTLKSADVQMLSTLNEIRERNMHDYYLAFRERFAPEYDMIHNGLALDFYEKTESLMIHMYSQRRVVIVPPAGATVVPSERVDEVVSRRSQEDTNEVIVKAWI